MPAFTASDGCNIHYDTFGSDGPRILLIPGLGGDGRFYAKVVKALEPSHRLIVMDHRGAGRSDRPEGPQSIETIAGDAAALLAATGGAAHLVGHSTGGAIVQVMALDHPETALSCTISGSWARADTRFRTLFSARAELLEAGLVETYQRLTHIFAYEPAYLDVHADRLDAVVGAARDVLAPIGVAAARLRMLLRHDRLDSLAAIRVPTQVIAAEDDILIPPYLTKNVADAIPNAQFHIVPGAHFHPMTHPEPFANLVRQFIAGVYDAR